MKRNLLLLIVLFSTMTMMAQNGKISYQAVVRDSENKLVYNTELQVTVALANSATGAAVYSEQHNVTSNANGLISLMIGGSDEVLPGSDWNAVQWNTAWVTATIRKVEGQTLVAEHHLPLSAVPYALYADFADSMNLEVLQSYLDEHHYVTEADLPTVEQSDWEEDDDESPAFIKNKPDLSVYATNAHLNDTLSYYATTNALKDSLTRYVGKEKLNDTLAYYATTSALKDSLTRYVDKDKLKDTLNKYYTQDNVDLILNEYEKKADLCNDVKECIKDTLKQYTTSDKIDTLLGAYYDTTQVKTAIHDTADVLRNMMVDAANDGQLTIIAAGDTTRFTANQATNDTMRLNKFATKDTLAYYATTSALKDSLTHYVGKEKLKDTLNRYYTKDNVDLILDEYEKKTELCNDVKVCINDTLAAYYDTTHTQSVISDTATALRAMMGEAAYDGQLTIIAAGDTTRFTANQATDDTVRLNKFATKDTLSYYYTSKKINDTLKHYYDTAYINQNLKQYLKSGDLCDSIVKCDVIKDMRDSLDNAFDTLNYYYTSKKINDTLKHYYDTAYINQNLKQYLKSGDLCDSIVKCDVIKDMRDSLDNAFDTLSYYYTSKKIDDTLKHYYDTAYINQNLKQYLKSGDLCDSIVKCDVIKDMRDSLDNAFDTLSYYYTSKKINDTLSKYTTTDKIDTIVNKHHFLTSDSTLIVRMRDSIQKVNAHVSADSLVLATRIHDDSLLLATRIHDDSLLLSTKIYNDSLKLATRIYDDSVALHKAIKDTATAIRATINNKVTALQTNIDTTSQHVRRDICDSATACITKALANPTSEINQAIDTIARNNIHDTAVAIRSLIPTVPDKVAITDQDNNFTATNTVPRGFVIKGDNPTNENNCNNIVVNACDLWAVFDSLTKRMDAMQETIEGLRDSVKTLMPKLSLVANPTSGVVCGDKPATITYIANISNGNTADYQLKWTVNELDSTNVTGPTLTCHFTSAGEYKVVCTATSAGRYPVKDSVTLNVTVGTDPVFSTSSNDLRLTLTSTSASDIDSIAWGDNNGVKNPTIPAEYEYSAAGTYTITVFSTTGCKEEKKVTVKVGIETDKLTPCNVTAAHTDNTVYTAYTGGLETTNENGAVTMVRDQDGHEYYVTQIGSQCWIAENLRSKKYSSSLSDTPTLILLPSSYDNDNAYYAYPDNDVANEETYGLLYNWTAAMGSSTLEGSQGICPNGWRMPKKSEMDMMISSAEASYAAGKLAGGSEGSWTNSENDKTPGKYDYSERNSSGFSALPAGEASNSNLMGIHNEARIWTSSFQNFESTDGLPTYFHLYLTNDGNAAVCHDYVGVSSSLSVRCIREAEGSSAPIAPTVSTASPATNITSNSATLSGTYSANGNTISAKGFEWALSGGSYTKKPVSGNELTCSLTDLLPDTNYVFRAYIVSNGATYYGSEVGFKTTTPPCGTSNMIDASGNSYEIVLIGSQCWTKTNLRTTMKRNGDNLTLGAAASSEEEAYYFKPESSEEWLVSSDFDGEVVVPFSSYNDSIFGYYYNWPSAAGEGENSLCPEGWRVPSIDDWNTLMTFSSTDATYYSCDDDPTHIAKALSYTSYWKSNEMSCSPGNTPSSNDESGFSAIPAGKYGLGYEGYAFFDAGIMADFWSSTHYIHDGMGEVGRIFRILWQNSDVDGSLGYWKDAGIPVRCVKDADGGGTPQTEPTVTTDDVTNKGETSATMNATITNVDNVTITDKGFVYKETVGGTYANFEGTITETTNGFAANLTNLTANTSYTYKAFITFGGNDPIYGDEVTFTTSAPFACGSKVSDAEGNEYTTVQIGSLCWMNQNLKSTHYSSLANNPTLNLNTGSNYSSSTACYSYPGNSETNVGTYGLLYNWNAVMGGSAADEGAQGICPVDWHVPTYNDMTSLAGDNIGYLSSNAFIPVLAGLLENDQGELRDQENTFGTKAYYWSSTVSANGAKHLKCTGTTIAQISDVESKDNVLYSVRCVRVAEGGDGPTQTDPTVTTGAATDVTSTSATLNAEFEANGNDITGYGFAWKVAGSSGGYTEVTEGVTHNDNDGTMSYSFIGQPGTYAYHGFITYSDGTVSGSDVEFTIPSESPATSCTVTTIRAGVEVGTGNTITAVKDNDDTPNEYSVVEIGGQCWMRENMKGTKYSPNLTQIQMQLVQDGNYSSSAAYYGYPGNVSGNEISHGLLYNLYAATGGYSTEGTQGICPDGWHLPTRQDFLTLLGTNNSIPSDFNVQTAGELFIDDGYIEVVDNMESANYWSSSKYQSYPYILSSQYLLSASYSGSLSFYSVRCVRDAESGGGSPSTDGSPTAETCNIVSLNNNQFKVTLTGIDFQVSTGGKVVVQYKCSNNCWPNETQWTTVEYNCSGGNFEQVIQGNQEGGYDVQVLLDNGEEPPVLKCEAEGLDVHE